VPGARPEGRLANGSSPGAKGRAPTRQRLVAGLDEAGRGPLAGPVFAAAVILHPRRRIRGVGDSKLIDPATRERLAVSIRLRCIAWGLGMADAEEVDALNVLGATWLAMRRALLALPVVPSRVRIDGNLSPSLDGLGLGCRGEPEIGGDGRILEIGAASILAKTARDAWMRRAARVYPGYGFEKHVGYGTPEHVAALDRLGPCRLHRRSFGPVRFPGLPLPPDPDRHR